MSQNTRPACASARSARRSSLPTSLAGMWMRYAKKSRSLVAYNLSQAGTPGGSESGTSRVSCGSGSLAAIEAAPDVAARARPPMIATIATQYSSGFPAIDLRVAMVVSLQAVTGRSGIVLPIRCRTRPWGSGPETSFSCHFGSRDFRVARGYGDVSVLRRSGSTGGWRRFPAVAAVRRSAASCYPRCLACSRACAPGSCCPDRSARPALHSIDRFDC